MALTFVERSRQGHFTLCGSDHPQETFSGRDNYLTLGASPRLLGLTIILNFINGLKMLLTTVTLAVL